MVQASTLLTDFEREHIVKTGSSFTVSVNGALYMVRPQQLVPDTAVVVKTSAGSLVGFPAVVGG